MLNAILNKPERSSAQQSDSTGVSCLSTVFFIACHGLTSRFDYRKVECSTIWVVLMVVAWDGVG